MISVTHKGKDSEASLKKMLKAVKAKMMCKKYAEAGVRALAKATPRDSGVTAESWYYDIEEDNNSITITWSNSNVVDGWAVIAILLQYGHGTGTGGYVRGRDYINPAMKQIFQEMADDLWEEVRNA